MQPRMCRHTQLPTIPEGGKTRLNLASHIPALGARGAGGLFFRGGPMRHSLTAFAVAGLVNLVYGAEMRLPVDVPALAYNHDDVVIGRASSGGGHVSSGGAMRISEAYANAKRGAITYFVGFGLELGVATPLMLAAIVNMDPGLLLAGTGVGMAATGLKVGGPIRCGVGGSLAYDYGSRYGLVDGEPKHWTFYRLGWVLTAVGAGVNVMANLSADQQTGTYDPAFGFVIIGLGIAADAMWITSCITSLNYARGAKERAGLAHLWLHPHFTPGGQSGMALKCEF